MTSVWVGNATVRIFRTQFPHNVYMGSEDLVQVIRYKQQALGLWAVLVISYNQHALDPLGRLAPTGFILG